jgi:simple sugar transport system permease protein
MNLSHFWVVLILSLQAMVPLVLTAVGEIIGETAGLFNIGLEGILLMSAFTGVLGAQSGGPWVGLLTGMLTGGAMSLIFSVITTRFKGTQMIAGIGINLFAVGFVAFGMAARGVSSLPQGKRLAAIQTPLGMGISPIVIVALVVPILAYFFLKRTRAGLILKAAGENPEAADVAGINVLRVRLLATTFGGILAGLAGAYISVSWVGSVTKDISQGRGFIALATVVFSGLNPLLALVGGIIFGFFESLAVWIRNMPSLKAIPTQFIAMTPYVVTLLVVAGVIGRVRFPKALGEPYRRE